MSMNNNDSTRNAFGGPSSFGIGIGSGGAMQQPPPQPQPQPPQPRGGPGHFQLSEPQPQTFVSQSQFGHHRALSPATTIRFQSPPHYHQANPAPIPASGSGAKRANQKPASRPSASSNPNAVSPLKTMELTPAASRKKPKLSERQIPDKVAALLPESALYTQLLELENRIDATFARKKIELQDSNKNPNRAQKTLRVYVFNTFANQASVNPGMENADAEPPSWSLKIVGRILEDGKDPALGGLLQNQSAPQPNFSSFFKKITIYLDHNLYPDDHVILWDSSRAPVLHEGFEVRRKGDKEFTAVIRLEMNYVPERFKLAPVLSEILGLEVDTRQRILGAIWFYVKVKKLQIPSDPSSFYCDPPLQRLFRLEKVKFSMVHEMISQYLLPLQPIHIEHTVKLSGNSPVGTTCYDVLVDMPLPLERETSAFLVDTEKHSDIDACDEVICSSIKKIQEHRRRRAFFLGFSQSPAEFIYAMIASQSKDLKLAARDASNKAEKEQRSVFYDQPWAEDAVIRYLNRKSAINDGPGGS